jgi:hypothetical protein
MKISAKTINILKNFSSINPSIVIKPGNVISTMSTNKTIIAKATVPDVFDNVVGLYKINEFIGSISLLQNPEIDFGETSLRMKSESGSEIEYHYSEPSTIVTPPENELRLPSVFIEVNISNKNLQDVTKALGLFGLPEIAIVGDGSNVWIQAIDVKNPSPNVFRVNIGETDKTFRAIFRAENMKIVDGDYLVKLTSTRISQFIGAEVTYWISMEFSSTF